MKLGKDDPIYYRNKINTLIKQAFENDIKIDVGLYDDAVSLLFKASNGDKAEVLLNLKK